MALLEQAVRYCSNSPYLLGYSDTGFPGLFHLGPVLAQMFYIFKGFNPKSPNGVDQDFGNFRKLPKSAYLD